MKLTLPHPHLHGEPRHRGDDDEPTADHVHPETGRSLIDLRADHHPVPTSSPANPVAADSVEATPARQGHEPRNHRRTLLVIITVSAIALVPWIVNLALTLPHRYVASDWRLTWVGFDVALFAFLAATAWLGWHRRQLVLLTAFTTGVLLCCDAWFDITTAQHHDRLTSVFSAFIEIPLAILMFRASWRLLRLAAGVLGQAGPDGSRVSIWKMPILGPAEAAADPTARSQSRFADPSAADDADPTAGPARGQAAVPTTANPIDRPTDRTPD